MVKLFFKDQANWSNLVKICTAFLLGLSVLAAVWLLLGLDGWLNLKIVLAILIVIIGLTWSVWQEAINLIKNIYFSIINNFENFSIFWKIISIILVLLIIFFGINALILPPIGDALAFYMVLPKITAYTGLLQPQSNYWEFSGIGFLGEMHFTVLLILAGQFAAKFFVWFVVLAVGGLIVLISRLTNLKYKGQILALILLFTSSTFTNYIFDGKTDVFSAALGLMTYYWLLKIESKDRSSIILTGLFMGFAIVAKTSNVIALLPGVFVVLGWNYYKELIGRKNFCSDWIKKTVITFGLVLIFALLAFSPQIVKNKVFYGKNFNISSFMGMSHEEVWADSALKKAPAVSINETKSISTTIGEPNHSKITVPVLVRMFDFMLKIYQNIEHFFLLFLTRPLAFVYGGQYAQYGDLSVLILAFLPIWLIERSNNFIDKKILTLALIGLILWVLIRSSLIMPRYIMSAILLWVIIVAGGVEKFFRQKGYLLLKYLVYSMITIIICVTLAGNFNRFKKFVLIVAGKLPSTSVNGVYYQSLEAINLKANNNERVFIVGAYDYFLRPDLLANFNSAKESDELFLMTVNNVNPWNYLYDHNFKYILIQRTNPNYRLIKVFDTAEKPADLNIVLIYHDYTGDVYSISKP
ncbi:MAG: hypothetical protein WCP93_01815 [Candidatus Berkelbacteria bacterium]